MKTAGAPLGILVLCVMWLLPGGLSDASAQANARRRVPPGEVTGLDMGIEGSLRAVPGGRVRWFVTLYEVVGQRNLRPAAGATLAVTASFAPALAVATVVTDVLGRAALDLPIPDDIEASVELRVDATSSRNVGRVFSVSLERAPRYEMMLLTDRAVSALGGRVMAFGRVWDRATGRPVEGAVVTTRVTNQQAPARRGRVPEDATTDQNGVFATAVDLGTTTGERAELRSTAVVSRRSAPAAVVSGTPASLRSVSATASVGVQEVPSSELWATATTTLPFATPGETIQVLVRGFGPDGRPLVNARVRPHGDRPRGARGQRGSRGGEREPVTRTNARGEATLEVRVPQAAPRGEWSQRFDVVHPGHGATTAELRVPVAHAPVLVSPSVEGGALVPELEGRVFVRVATPDGAPLRRQELLLEAPRLGGTLHATTDADGVASFVAHVGPDSTDSSDHPCGGTTAMAATLVVGEHRERLCLPVDLDGTLSVRAPLLTGPGEPISVTVDRRPRIARRPVEVTALVQRDGRWLPVARTLLRSGVAESSLTVPSSVRGEVWLRGRPLLEGGVPGRGGGVFVYRGAAPTALEVEVEGDGGGARVVGRTEAGGASTTLLFAVDARARSAFGQSLRERSGPLETALLQGRGPAYLSAIAAAHTPRDETASVEVRGGELTTLSLPRDPVAHGLLRDPWRTRSRFIRGRVGRLMRAVEDYVARQDPGAMADVATFRRGHFRFNASIVDATAVEAGLGDEAMASLGGDPLDIASLTTLDSAFTFDNVARRITRERLFRLLVQLRDHIHVRGLGRPWSRRGDPREYLATLLDSETQYSADWPEYQALHDGWGRPFVLRPRRGAARFSFLEPVSGWELVSVGPDGRPGTHDDLVDPFARVLPSRGIYAEAVGEDVLLARVRGVALGRATIASLAEVFDVPLPELLGDGEALVGLRHPELPTSFDASRASVAAGGDRPPLPHLGEFHGGLGARQVYRLPEEHRPYAAVAVAFRRDGGVALGGAAFEAGVPFLARVSWPVALRAGERLVFPVHLRRYADGEEPAVEVFARGGVVRASMERRHAEGGAHEVVLEALRPGMARVVLRTTMEDGTVVTHAHRVRVVPRGSLRARHGVAIAAPNARIDLSVPDGATPWRGQVVIGAPEALAADPVVAAALERHPAIASWARTLSGRAVGEALEAHLDGAAGALGAGLPSDIDRACALVAWAARPAESRQMAQFNSLSSTFASSVSVDLRTRAAVLTALAVAAPGVPTGGVYDPVAGVVSALREDGWRALSNASDEPAVMARMAAALLIIDREDVPGRALYRRALGSLEANGEGRRSVRGNPHRPGDAFIGTLALALAARQLGDDALADELRASALHGLHQVSRLGAEGAFWPAAASILGAFGVGVPAAVEVSIDGARRPVALGDDGVAILDVRAGARVAVQSDHPVWVRTETRYLVPDAARDGAALRARLEGAVGVAPGRAAFEVVVQNEGSGRVGRPMIEIVVPGAGRLDDEAATMIEAAPGVRRLSGPDGAGVIRIALAPMRGGEERRFALPLLWSARGRTSGLGLATYDAARPSHVSTTPGRVLQIEGRDE